MRKNNRVVYFYDDEVGDYLYNNTHPMKPHRMKMTHDLILSYNLYEGMRVKTPRRATALDLTRYHTDEYIQFLQMCTPYNTAIPFGLMEKFNLGDDSPVYHGVYEFCQISAGGSISAAEELNSGKADIAINWAGGLHHAKKAEASGFCYVADCVLGILKLLETFDRVMYIDIDIHHGDGVEEAFYTSNRVLTVSFHKFGDYFPGSGNVTDVGIGDGKHYSVNVPLKDGMDDEAYDFIFKPVIRQLIEWYKPGAILLQCGADSLSGDRLGCFNLSIKGHAECVKYVKSFNLPLLVTGGGGYTVRNVARCWAYETAVLLDQEITNDIPYNDYIGYYSPEYQIHYQTSNMENQNSQEDLERLQMQINESIRHAPSAPSVQIGGINPLALLQDSDTSEDDFIYTTDIQNTSTAQYRF